MFPILQGCLQKEVFPQQTVCADVDIVTGIFYRCPKVSGKGRAIGDTGGYAPPFGIEIRCKIAVGQMKTKFIPPVHVNPEKPDVPLNKNDAFQKVQKRRVQEKR